MGCEEEGVVPDVIFVRFGGGVMPITGIIARPHLWTDEIKKIHGS